MDDPATRRAFRQFVRAHHPDRGGDPEVFIAGLAMRKGSAWKDGAWEDTAIWKSLAAEPDVATQAGSVTQSGRRRPPPPTAAYKRRSIAAQLWVHMVTSLRNRIEPQPPRVQ